MNEHMTAKVLQLLSSHIGKSKGISAAMLALEAKIDERQLRKCVSSLRDDGVAVCGTPASGYFIARTADELEECCEFLRSRALHSLSIEAKLRKITLPDLIGQLKIPT